MVAIATICLVLILKCAHVPRSSTRGEHNDRSPGFIHRVPVMMVIIITGLNKLYDCVFLP